MDFLSAKTLAAYWSSPEVGVNVVIFLNLLGSLLLGLLVGYERSFHGRAAGMRTYGAGVHGFDGVDRVRPSGTSWPSPATSARAPGYPIWPT